MQARKRLGTIMVKTYTLYINAYTPETIPMARLAEYMQHFAVVLGREQKDGIHFDKMEQGSTQLAARIDHEYIEEALHFGACLQLK